MSTRVLVAIANHGTGNRLHLDRLLAEYRRAPWSVDVVILSNVPKDLGPDIEVRVGAPSRNPWSLPFAHRVLFRERLDAYDMFVYSEDDTLVTSANLRAFEWAAQVLNPDEIAGFLRTESEPDGTLHYSTCHAFFRWKPASVCERGGCLWAEYTNEHAACFMATRSQLKRAIASGGFPVEPHEGRYDMLCSAATDIFARCGFRRLVCLDRLGEFSLPHLPNKYIGKMGLRADFMNIEIESLRAVYRGDLPDYELIDPETALPGGRGSKRYDELPDTQIEQLLPTRSGRLLSWGCGLGELERGPISRGWQITAVPLDAVVGAIAQRREIALTYGPRADALSTLRETHFDAALCTDILHLADDPEGLAGDLAACLKPGGVFVARVPNFFHGTMLKSRLRDSRYPRQWNRASVGAWPLRPHQWKAMMRAVGLDEARVICAVPERYARLSRAVAGLADRWLAPALYVRAVRR